MCNAASQLRGQRVDVHGLFAREDRQHFAQRRLRFGRFLRLGQTQSAGKLLENVVRVVNELRAVLDQAMRSLRAGGENRAGDREDFASLLGREFWR